MFLLRVFLLTAAVYVQFTEAENEMSVLEMFPTYTQLKAQVTKNGAEVAHVKASVHNAWKHILEGKTSVLYTRWGKKACPPHSHLVYSGFAGGSYFNHPGAAVEPLCLPRDPQGGRHFPGIQADRQYMFAAEYEVEHGTNNGLANTDIHNFDVPCAVCLTLKRSSLLMIPGRKTCYNGWHQEYTGYLMSGRHSWAAASKFTCVDEHPEAIPGTGANKDGYLFYHVETLCGYMDAQCPPYEDGRELTCVVCSV